MPDGSHPIEQVVPRRVRDPGLGRLLVDRDKLIPQLISQFRERETGAQFNAREGREGRDLFRRLHLDLAASDPRDLRGRRMQYLHRQAPDL